MIDQFNAKPKTKRLRILIDKMTVYIAEYDRTPEGKFKLIDMAFGNPEQVVLDLKQQGYELHPLKDGAK